ncbi:MAG: hypothetical protein QM689_12500 [Oscillospiraceae bacterium]
MPVPFILGGIAIAAAATGIGKGIHAGVQNSEAKDVNSKAGAMYKTSKEALEKSRKASAFALNALGEAKVRVLDESINRFVGVFETIHNVELEGSDGLNELPKFRVDKQYFEDMKKMGKLASSLAAGVIGGGLAGGLAAFGAYSAAMTFGAASTGTAIATLSGAAATNATLAFLGGGSLAAGGFGIAGGTMVLGGIVAGPALAIMGFFLDAKASKNVDNAYSNLAQAQKISEELMTASSLCNAIEARAKMFFDLLVKLDNLLNPLTDKMEMITVLAGNDYTQYNKPSKDVVAKALTVAGAIKTLLDTPILTIDGKLTEESKSVSVSVEKLLTVAG